MRIVSNGEGKENVNAKADGTRDFAHFRSAAAVASSVRHTKHAHGTHQAHQIALTLRSPSSE